MAEETKNGIKMEEETKPLKKLCEKLEESISHEFNKGIDKVDVMEMKEAIDMLKDLYEAKKYMLEGCYFKSVVEAMEEHDFEDEEDIMDEGRRGYRGQPRSESGRFMSRGDGRRSNRGRGRRGYESPMMMYDEEWDEMERMRDLDRGAGKMYYSGSGSAGSMSGGQSSGGMSGSSSSSGGSRGYYESGNQGGGRDSREGRSGQSRRGYIESKEIHKGNTAEDKQAKMKELEKYAKELTDDVVEMVENASPEERSLLKSKMSALVQKL